MKQLANKYFALLMLSIILVFFIGTIINGGAQLRSQILGGADGSTEVEDTENIVEISDLVGANTKADEEGFDERFSGLAEATVFDRITNFTSADLPELLNAITDKSNPMYWNWAAQIIAYQPPQEISTKALIDYISRWDNWQELDITDPESFVLQKVAAVELLGIVADDTAIAFLKNAADRDGAKSILSTWQDKMLPSDDLDDAVFKFQGYALIGLALTQDPEGVHIVQSQYNLLRSSYSNTAGKKDKVNFSYYCSMLDAMTTIDLIRTMGREKYLQSRTDLAAKENLLNQHTIDYDFGVQW